MSDLRSRQKAVLDRMAKALADGEDLLVTEDGTLAPMPPSESSERAMARPTAEQHLFEEVRGALDLFPGVLDEDLERDIVETVMRLPQNMREYVSDECRFVSVAYARTMQGGQRARWVILLTGDMPADDVHSLIAHEIALVWLQHRHRGMPCTLGLELAASRLVRRWGFEGQGADVEDAQAAVNEYGPATLFMNLL
jgi:hypothetical protein